MGKNRKYMAGKKFTAQLYQEALHMGKNDRKENLVKIMASIRKENVQKRKCRYLVNI